MWFRLALLAVAALLGAQSPAVRFPPGTFQNRAAIDAGGAAPYFGPGDVVSGAFAWWGLRCYNAAYSGNVARIKSPSDVLTTTITCSAGGVLGSTGTALATTCAVSCTVDILYDQSGALSCGGAACDLLSPTEANRPLLTRNYLGTNSTISFTGTSQELEITPGLTAAQPFNISMVYNRTSSTGSFTSVITSNGAQGVVGNNSANSIFPWASASIAPCTASDATDHAMQFIFDNAGTGSYCSIDGSNTSVNIGASTGFGNTKITIGNDGTFAATLMNIGEVGIWGTPRFSTTNSSNMNSNQHIFWGF